MFLVQLSFAFINWFWWNFQKLFSLVQENTVLINYNNIIMLLYHHLGAAPQQFNFGANRNFYFLEVINDKYAIKESSDFILTFLS